MARGTNRLQVEVVMPRLSDSMEEGTVARWLVDEGAAVVRGQPLVEIDTDKATMEYEAEADGTLAEILLREGESAPIGTPIARLATSGDATPPSPREPASRGRVNASPVARRLARERGVDLATVEATGQNGMITREDVERSAGGDAATGGVQALSRVQQAIARHMVEAGAVPTFAAEIVVDMAACLELRASIEPKPSVNDLVVKACALALREHPRVNASYSEQGFQLYPQVNVGIAVASDDALLVPVVHEADRKSLHEIADESKALSEKARSGTLTPADLDGGTFTVSNLGMHGIRRFEALLNTPQAAILAVGAVEQRPAIDGDGKVVARPQMSATLVCDHRILYGADAARFLARLRELLEAPEPLTR